MANQSENHAKVVLGDGKVLVDLTSDTVRPDKVLKDYTGHGADGQPFVGSCTYDADTSDANATDAEILDGKVAYVRGVRVTGKMPNHEGADINITSLDGESIGQGYHDGSGKAKIADAEKEKLIPSNIRGGVTILGVEGSMSGSEDVKAHSREVTPSMQEQNVLPAEGYNYLTSVKVNAIPVTITENAAGGTTVTIG